MRLVEAHITNFRSAEDSGAFTIDQVTCLVGKNEAGKSAILLALAALNPHHSTPAIIDKERDYPRRLLNRYDELNPNGKPLAVSTVWQLDADELNTIQEAVGPSVVTKDRVTVTRRFETAELEWKVDIDLKRAISNCLKGGIFDAAQIVPLQTSKNTKELIAQIESLPSPTEAQSALLEKLRKFGSFTDEVHRILKTTLPSFMYFSNYDRMDGAVQFEQLQQLENSGQLAQEAHRGAKLFLEFMEYAGVPLENILEVNTYETFNARLQGASNDITDQILEYWTQNPDLEVRVDIRDASTGDPPPFNAGTIGRARIYNQLHRVDTPFSERSAGFVWFFSFLIKFARVKAEGRPVVLLLDEPGLSLHGKAQADLLRYFDDKLAPHHQIIYSTHSPFMVSPDKLMSARIVEDQVEIKAGRRTSNGTKVREDVLTKDPDTLFPLQGALGYEVTQTLFIGKHTLLVEGASDILYLQALSHELKRRKRTGLNEAWTVCPSGGLGNVRAFVSLFGGNKLDIAVLADQTKGDLKKIDELRRSDILKAGRVFTMAQFVDKAEADVEDIFDAELFVDILNEAFRLPAKHRLTSAKLQATEPNTERLVKKAEAAFNVLPDQLPIFDHFTPSAWLIANLQQLEHDTDAVKATLDRAEALFVAVNGALAGDVGTP